MAVARGIEQFSSTSRPWSPPPHLHRPHLLTRRQRLHQLSPSPLTDHFGFSSQLPTGGGRQGDRSTFVNLSPPAPTTSSPPTASVPSAPPPSPMSVSRSTQRPSRHLLVVRVIEQLSSPLAPGPHYLIFTHHAGQLGPTAFNNVYPSVHPPTNSASPLSFPSTGGRRQVFRPLAAVAQGIEQLSSTSRPRDGR